MMQLIKILENIFFYGDGNDIRIQVNADLISAPSTFKISKTAKLKQGVKSDPLWSR